MPRNLMIVLYVPDMEQALAFYREGLGLTVTSHSPGWSMLSCGDAIVGLHLIYKGVDEQRVPHAGLNLQIDDLEAGIEQAVQYGATLVAVSEPDRAGLPRLGVLRAPDGNGFELRQQI